MNLPTIVQKQIEIKLPVTKKKVKIRPFTVKEQKNLLLAVEQTKNLSKSEKDIFILSEFAVIMQSCLITDMEIFDLPLADFMYICLQLRSISVGDTVEAKYKCPCGTRVDVEFNIDNIKCLNLKNKYEKEFNVSDDIVVTVGLLKMKDVLLISRENEVDLVLDTIARSIVSISDKDTVYDVKDIDPEEVKEFVSNIPISKMKEFEAFIESTPFLVYSNVVNCPTGSKTLEVRNIQDFFIS